MKKIITLLSITLLGSVMIINCTQNADNDEHVALTPDEWLKKGEYLVQTGHCDDCHTPKLMTDKGPTPDMNNRFMGFQADRPLPEVPKSQDWVYFTPDLLAAVGPWGTTFSANISSSDTGIGNWSFDQFKNSLVKGMHKGLANGRPVLPPMPVQNTANYTEEDLKAIYDYLLNSTPIDNQVPSAILAPRN